MLLRTVIVWLGVMPLAAFSQVHSLTLGVDVNSPYGLSEPWFTIRTALTRCDDLENVAERPDVKTATAQATPKAGRLPDMARLQKVVSESGAGATLRGVEVTVEGKLIAKEDKLLLRLAERELLLQPFTESIHHERKKPRPATPDEIGAYEHLQRQAAESKTWRVTGPLRLKSDLVLEVRAFEQSKTKESGEKL